MDNVNTLTPELSQLFEKYPGLSDTGIKLITAIAGEIGGPKVFVQRNKINTVSKSFPYDHRTMANRDVLKTGPTEKILVGKHILYGGLSLLEMLCKDLMKKRRRNV